MNSEKTHQEPLDLKLWLQCVLILAVCICSFFIQIDADELEIMEARNFIAAREMVADGSWLLPTMNGKLRFEKPPLPTWITAVAVMMGGSPDHMTAMRIPAAITATLMIFIAFGFFRSLTDKNTLLAFIMSTLLAVNVFVIVLGRRNSWDIYAHCFMLAVIWALWAGWKKENDSPVPFIIGGIAAGLSFLSKGPVDFYTLLLPFSVAYVSVYGIRPIWEKRIQLLVFFIVGIVVASAWPLYVFVHAPKIGMTAANNEVRDWGIDRVRPFYYYLSFPLFSGVWIVMLAAYAIKSFAKPRMHSIFPYAFPIVWLLVTVVLLSAVPQKKERYLMPAAVPMSMMIGFMVYSLSVRYRSFQQTYGDRVLIRLHTGLAAAVSLAIPLLYYFLNKGLSVSVITGAILFLVFGLTAWLIIKAGKNQRVMSLFFLTQILMCLAIPVLWNGISMMDHNNKEFKSLLEFSRDHEVSGLDFYSTTPIKMTAVWDIGQKVLPWKYTTTTIPPNRKFILFFQDGEEAEEFASDYGNNIHLTVLDEYRWNPTNPRKIIIAALIES